MFRSPKAVLVSTLQFGKLVLVLVNGVDLGGEAEQFSQGQGKRAGTSPQVRERCARNQVCWAEKIYMVMMVHWRRWYHGQILLPCKVVSKLRNQISTFASWGCNNKETLLFFSYSGKDQAKHGTKPYI